MPERTIVLRKDEQWYVVNSADGDEEAILLTLLEYAEHETYNIDRGEVFALAGRLGWDVEVHGTLGAA